VQQNLCISLPYNTAAIDKNVEKYVIGNLSILVHGYVKIGDFLPISHYIYFPTIIIIIIITIPV